MSSMIITVSLSGGVFVRDGDGNDMTPRSAKGRALIALLAVHERMQRSRAWLQSKLWSDRAAEQASGSLRQEIAGLRRALEAHAGVVLAGRHDVAFDTSRVKVEMPCGADAAEKFLEGLDIRDEEFNDWLREMRSSMDLASPLNQAGIKSTPDAKVDMPGIRFVARGIDGTTLRVIEDSYIEIVAKSLRESLGVPITIKAGPDGVSLNTYEVQVQARELGRSGISLANRLFHAAPPHHLIWSENCAVEDLTGPIGHCASTLAQSHQLSEEITRLYSGGEAFEAQYASVDEIAATALQRMFSLDAKDWYDAQQLWDRAIDIDPRGVFYAWRAQLAAFSYVERRIGDRDSNREISTHFCNKAMAIAPHNSIVLALNATSQLIFEDNANGSIELSRLAIKSNSANPVAWWAYCNAQLYGGRYEDAYKTAQKARALSQGSRLQFWNDFQMSLAAAVTGRMDEAISYGESSAMLSPNYKPPLRYLTALYMARSDLRHARRTAAALAKIEPEFRPEQLVEDGDYPVSMMRQAGLLGLKHGKTLRALNA